ncbi:MAG: VOC family protein [Candidatus Eremiobacteraeota bacterium]|nr:VOC family protein [Candidatus Eremiobacteraeota bacterium]MCW5870274.1 VOC family protein [Candidatus Eremiobacteraeota bacterium]
MFIANLDHLVLTVRDVGATVRFYTQVLGMQLRTFGEGRQALHFGTQKINLHQAQRPVDANVRQATPGSADLCFLLTVPLSHMQQRLLDHGVAVITGPVVRTGAQGEIRSLYFYDPDENLIEVSEPLPGAVFEPKEGPAREQNQSFHQLYQQRLQQWLENPGRPVLLQVADSVIFRHRGQRQQLTLRPPSYHLFKAEVHARAAECMRGAPMVDFTAALEQGARMELEDLHAAVFPWWSHLTVEERQRCAICVATPHQPREGRLSLLYLERLSGRRTGVGASLDDGLVVLEMDCDEHTALLGLARHYLDQEIGELFFGDRFRMQRDVMAEAAGPILDELLGLL